MNLLALPGLYWRSLAASRYARRHEFAGQAFDRFGRRLGYRLLRHGQKNGIGYVINPVSMIRYFEFAFALKCLKSDPGECLDVSSPRLFSYYAAAHFPEAKIHMINPDGPDIEHSALVVRRMDWKNVTTAHTGVDAIAREGRTYDTIWSISVIEHIAGKYDETWALRLMYGCLRPGGRLIVTTTADRNAWDEYRSDDPYGTQPDRVAGKHFFQRWYDNSALESRIFSPLNVRPSRIEWFGEMIPGRFVDYDRRFVSKGWKVTVDDVREFRENYRAYESWDQMPGAGVVGFMIEKP
jgi:hypothetical protein